MVQDRNPLYSIGKGQAEMMGSIIAQYQGPDRISVLRVKYVGTGGHPRYRIRKRLSALIVRLSALIAQYPGTGQDKICIKKRIS
jgi:hypothetical protein